jgi:hypothetical protein
VIYALGQPLAALGLVVAFLVGLAVRAAVQGLLARRLTGTTTPGPLLQPRRDVDPFGAVGAVLGGTGWGRAAPVPPLPVGRSIGRRPVLSRVLVYLAGPVVPVVLGEAVLAGYQAAFPGGLGLSVYQPSDVLRGAPGPPLPQLLLSFGVGLLCFGLFAIIPLPPCDGWGLLWLAWRRPGDGARKVRFWLEERNIGVVALLILTFPLGLSGPLLHPLLDLVGTPFLRVLA